MTSSIILHKDWRPLKQKIRKTSVLINHCLHLFIYHHYYSIHINIFNSIDLKCHRLSLTRIIYGLAIISSFGIETIDNLGFKFAPRNKLRLTKMDIPYCLLHMAGIMCTCWVEPDCDTRTHPRSWMRWRSPKCDDLLHTRLSNARSKDSHRHLPNWRTYGSITRWRHHHAPFWMTTTSTRLIHGIKATCKYKDTSTTFH